jgi:hypothetical protein
MSFDRERFEKILHDAGGAFETREAAERAVRDCGGEIKGKEPRVIERQGGHVVRRGEALSIITAIEPEVVIDERSNKQPVYHAAHARQNVTRNGPHEFIEYVPIGEPAAIERDNGKKVKRGNRMANE